MSTKKQAGKGERALLSREVLATVREGDSYAVTRQGSRVHVVVDRAGTHGEGPQARKIVTYVPLTPESKDEDDGDAESLRALLALRLAFESCDLPTIDGLLGSLGIEPDPRDRDSRLIQREALYRVLFVKGRPWGEARPLAYLAAAVRSEARRLRDARKRGDTEPVAPVVEDHREATALRRLKHQEKDNIEDESPDPRAVLYRRELAAKALALPSLREGERRILEIVLRGEAASWSEARDAAALPDSYRVGLLKKLRTLAS